LSLSFLSRKVGKALQANGQSLATAESCTGGWVAEAVTSIAGSSAWFDRGFVTYSNEAKRELLGVPRATIARYGAVSEATARAMAKGALRRSRGTIALSVTGVAGPGGGTREKPLGMVCFAWVRGRKIRSETRRFKGGRASVRRQSVAHALKGVLKWL